MSHDFKLGFGVGLLTMLGLMVLLAMVALWLYVETLQFRAHRRKRAREEEEE